MPKTNPTGDQKLRELVLFVARSSERDEHFGATKLSVSELSHEFLGWQLAAEGEEIPYSTVLLGHPRPPTPAEVEYGFRLQTND